MANKLAIFEEIASKCVFALRTYLESSHTKSNTYQYVQFFIGPVNNSLIAAL